SPVPSERCKFLLDLAMECQRICRALVESMDEEKDLSGADWPLSRINGLRKTGRYLSDPILRLQFFCLGAVVTKTTCFLRGSVSVRPSHAQNKVRHGFDHLVPKLEPHG